MISVRAIQFSIESDRFGHPPQPVEQSVRRSGRNLVRPSFKRNYGIWISRTSANPNTAASADRGAGVDCNGV
ncbi:MAG: hypothetical protein AAF720_02030 [Pseudomonadota bacterium]